MVFIRNVLNKEYGNLDKFKSIGTHWIDLYVKCKW